MAKGQVLYFQKPDSSRKFEDKIKKKKEKIVSQNKVYTFFEKRVDLEIC